MKVLGILSSVTLNVAIWSVIAAFTTVGLAVADVSATTFYVVWAFFAAVMIGGSVLMIKWGAEGRRWLWRIAISWTLLFLISIATLLLVLIPIGLLCVWPRFRRWLAACLIPPPPAGALPKGAR